MKVYKITTFRAYLESKGGTEKVIKTEKGDGSTTYFTTVEDKEDNTITRRYTCVFADNSNMIIKSIVCGEIVFKATSEPDNTVIFYSI